MSAGFLCGITLELFTDKCYGQAVPTLVITPCAVTRDASASSQIQFH